ncbi:hypothetical protein V1514DRAFT_327274 [Lipomyces japonicus]|uniref:uncharacterized protein n=1 Tax=Lipomyces japonicus TaxID=56871 RepID=UPI0034CFAC8B
MALLACPAPLWDVDDFNSCIKHRYFEVGLPIFSVIVSIVYLGFSGTIKLPNFLRRRLHRKGYSRLDSDVSPIDEDSEDESPIYRLRTTDASAEHDEISNNLDVEDNTLVNAPRTRTSGNSDVFLLDTSPSRRFKAVLEEVIAATLAVVHVLSVVGVILLQYPPQHSQHSKVFYSTLANAILAIYIFVLASIRLSPSVRYNTPFLRVHVAILYLFLLVIKTVNLRSSIIESSFGLIKFLDRLDFVLYASLFLIILFSPIRDRPAFIETEDGSDPNPVPYSTLYETITFSWANDLLKLGYSRPLTMSDVWDLKDECRSALIMPGYIKAKQGGTLLYGMLKSFKSNLLYGFVFSTLYAIFTFSPTILVRQILRHLEDPSREPTHMAWLYVFLLLGFAIVNATCSAQALWTFRETSVKTRAVIVAELYQKALRRKLAVNVPDTSQSSDGEAEVDKKSKDKDESKIEDESIDLGRLINLMAVDAFSISEVLARLNPIIKGTLMIFISMVLLYQTLGASAIAGSLGMLTLLPINYKFSRTFGKIQKELLGITDRRIQKTNEILQSIKIIKFFAWEVKFADSLNEVRKEELRKLRKRFIILALAAMIWFGFPTIITFITFGAYTLIAKKQLTASVAFSSLSLFNLMRTPMDRLAEMITNVIEARTSLERVQKFLDEEETQKYAQLNQVLRTSDAPLIGFRNASFSWSSNATSYDFKLQDIDVSFAPGKLTVIVGPTGAGKSSLLLALLGEMNIVKGHVYLPGASALEQPSEYKNTGLTESVAYCAQQPWLLNGTVKENILFGSEYDETRYEQVIKLCALIRDFQILEDGDLTQVGEKGISLSGGQKQRISLARALYSKARHVILDDCLSAVDSHTALYLYENCIAGPLMKHRTCILVSHNVALTLTLAHHVVVVENGRIVAQGLPAEVVTSGVLGSDELLINSVVNSRDISRSGSSLNISDGKKGKSKTISSESTESPKEVEQNSAPKKSREEVQQVGMVKLSVYLSYFKAMGAVGFWASIAFAFFVHQVAAIGQSYWVKVWSAAIANIEMLLTNSSQRRDNFVHQNTGSLFEYSPQAGVSNVVLPLLQSNLSDKSKPSFSTLNRDSKGPEYYLAIYGVIAIIYIVLSFLREGLFYWGSLSASKRLFDKLLGAVMRAKPRFFDQTPVGRIINRFSKDVESIDREVAVDALSFAHSCLSVAVIIGVISFILPEFLIVGIVICALFFMINLFYLQSSRELKRMQSVTRSPIYQHFGETLVGVPTIRAYGYEQKFISQSMHKVDTNSRPYWIMWALNRWMCFRTDISGGLVSFFAGVFVMVSANRIDSGLAGLILTYAISFTENMFWVVLLYATNEMNMNSVERIDEFLSIEQEAPDIIPGSRPPHGWPNKGSISVDDLALRYAPELPRVIKGISFEVEPNMKVGIVGRTGAGKSTIASAFFRFLEADQGKIVIDGVDISKIGLRDLRQGLTIIPQDPTLFSGTVRSNLDPFNNYSDEQIFTALKHVHLIDTDSAPTASTSSTPAVELSEIEREAHDMNVFYRLDSPVTEGGGNLSQGQRQLMCLARSLLRFPKIILLDEATASIDYNTDARIQETIRTEFSETTVLTIAHRLRSIIDYDKILVLDSGHIQEYDHPHILLQQPDSIFRSMCSSSGELEALEELANQAYDKKLHPLISANSVNNS